MNLINNAKSRICSDRADSNTTSQILWIAMTVVLVIAVATLIGKAVMKKGESVSDTIEKSDTQFGKDIGADKVVGNN